MINLAGNPQATVLCAVELQAAQIPIVVVAPVGEVRSEAGGSLGGFTFKRYWVYWVVRHRAMSQEHADLINKSPRPEGRTPSAGAGTWGDVIRVNGYAGGTDVYGPVENWHIDTPDGLAFFAKMLRDLGYAC